MHRRRLNIVSAFVVAGVAAVVAVLLVANVLFAGPSAATLENNAVSACASSLDGGFEVGEAYAEADHRAEIKAASFEDGAFRPDRLVNDSETVYYVTGTGPDNSKLLCTASAVDDGAFMTQYEKVEGTWLG